MCKSRRKTSLNNANLPIYKVVVAGDGNVGKTSLVRRYCEGRFEESRVMTLGVDFQTKVVTVGEKTVKLSIWDVAGQERFATFRDAFYGGAQAAALVYDVTSRQSFLNLPRWHDEIQSVVPHVPMVVIGNKADLTSEVSEEEVKAWANQFEMPMLLTSAAKGSNVEEFFTGLAWLAIRKRGPRDTRTG
jgi:small GTP-binding protein